MHIRMATCLALCKQHHELASNANSKLSHSHVLTRRIPYMPPPIRVLSYTFIAPHVCPLQHPPTLASARPCLTSLATMPITPTHVTSPTCSYSTCVHFWPHFPTSQQAVSLVTQTTNLCHFLRERAPTCPLSHVLRTPRATPPTHPSQPSLTWRVCCLRGSYLKEHGS